MVASAPRPSLRIAGSPSRTRVLKLPAARTGASGAMKRPAARATSKATEAQRQVHLIDALPYVFRAYYSIPTSVTDPKGRPSNAVVGFAGFLVRYINEEKPTHVGLCFDSSMDSSFRNELYPAYKGTRTATAPSLSDQVGRCWQFAEAIGIKCYIDDKLEADDILASLAEPLLANGHECVVTTSDKDMCQLVGPHLTVYDFAKGERYDEAGVKRRMGVRPEQVTDFLGLAGDAVDNIPGVKGLGSKTATALLEKFSNLEDIYANIERVAGMNLRGSEGIAARLKDQRPNAFLSKQLATLKRQRIPKGTLSHLRRKNPTGGWKTILDELGVSRLQHRIEAFPKASPAAGSSAGSVVKRKAARR